MKKFYAFFAAALMSASLFAAAPTPADLAAEYDLTNNVVLCLQFIDEAQVCNDIRFVGTPNNWGKGEGDTESFDNCEKFMPVAGFDGWYAAELPYSEGFEGKPLQEPSDRAWTWDYQCGDADAWVFVGGNEATMTPGFAGEVNIAYASAGAYIYQLKYWKNHKTPCAPIVKHNYKISLYAPEACPEMKPAISGDDMGWGTPPFAMNEELDPDFNTVYTYSFIGQEGHAFKIRAVNDDENWSNQMMYYDVENDTWKTFENIELGADSNIVLDWSDDDLYRFAKCDNSPLYWVVFGVKLPALNCPQAVEVIGTFDGWQGTALTFNASTGYFVTEDIEAKESDYFKFRSAGLWPDQGGSEIEVFNPETQEWNTIKDNDLVFGQLWSDDTWKGEPCKLIELDLSNPDMYRWSVPQGIENVVLTEKANKVMVDGILYIVRDNKLFNVQGTQVR